MRHCTWTGMQAGGVSELDSLLGLRMRTHWKLTGVWWTTTWHDNLCPARYAQSAGAHGLLTGVLTLHHPDALSATPAWGLYSTAAARKQAQWKHSSPQAGHSSPPPTCKTGLSSRYSTCLSVQILGSTLQAVRVAAKVAMWASTRLLRPYLNSRLA